MHTVFLLQMYKLNLQNMLERLYVDTAFVNAIFGFFAE